MAMKEITLVETNQEYCLDSMLDTQIEKVDFSIKENENFKQSLRRKWINSLSRNNILKYGIMMGEVPVPIEKADGKIAIPIINKSQIDKRKKAFPEQDRSKINWIHISTIQIIIKSTFMKGIDAPLSLHLEDSRINNPKVATIAQGKCNLKYGKVKFDVNLQMGMSLKDNDLDRSILFGYQLGNPTLMKKGNHPFSVSYKINYALSNSHHSVEFKNKEKIYIDELFEPILELESPVKFTAIERCNSMILPRRSYFSEFEYDQSIKELSDKVDQLVNRI